MNKRSGNIKNSKDNVKGLKIFTIFATISGTIATILFALLGIAVPTSV